MKIDPRLLDLKLIRKLTSPTLSDVHVDELLTEIVIGYPNAGFIAEELSPVVEVTGETGKYTKWGRENVDIPQTGRAPGADFKRVDVTVDLTGVYACEEYGLEYPLEDRAVKNSNGPVKLEEVITLFIQNMLEVDREKRTADLLCSTDQYASTNYTTKTSAYWSDYSTTGGDPTAEIDTGKQAIEDNAGVTPNGVALPAKVFRYVRRNPYILKELRGRTDRIPGRATLADLAEIWEVEKVVVARAKYNTSAEGQTRVLVSPWGRDVVLAYTAPANIRSLLTPAFSYTLRVKGSQEVSKYREKNTRTVIQNKYGTMDEIVTSNVSGYLIKNAIDASV